LPVGRIDLAAKRRDLIDRQIGHPTANDCDAAWRIKRPPWILADPDEGFSTSASPYSA
jgi:hypothetical protein